MDEGAEDDWYEAEAGENHENNAENDAADDGLFGDFCGVLGDADSEWNFAKVVCHDDDGGGVAGGGGAKSRKRHADVGGGEDWGVVDAVAYEGGGFLEAADDFDFVGGETFGVIFGNANGFGGFISVFLGVAGDDGNVPESELSETIHYGFGFAAHVVGEGDLADDFAVDAEED